MPTEKKLGVDVDVDADLGVEQDVTSDTKANASLSVETKPVKVGTTFESTMEVSFPEFRAGTSGFKLELFGIPFISMDPCYIGTERASEFFGELLCGEETTTYLPSYKITEKCIGCSTCARQCPTGAIYGVMKQRFTINSHQCILCGTCGRSCPANAIVDEHDEPVKRVKVKEKKVPTVDKELCSGCQSCVNICPFNCLAIEEDEAVETIKGISYLKNKAKCVACGECERICAQEAILLLDPVPSDDKAKKVA